MPRTVVHMIGQAHLDPVWLWRWTEGRAEALATSRSAADRLDEYPAFVFTRGEAQVYAWIAQEDPELFERVLAHIRAGRWSVVNGMVIQPDMNLPQGESLVRQALLGRAWMREHLGVEPRVAYCVDSFGHAGTLPQILRGCGFDAYVMMRPQEHEKELPARVFQWRGPDGSSIPTFRIAGAYTFWGEDIGPHLARALEDVPEGLGHTMCFFGVGNHGGGPTRRQIEAIERMAAERDDVEIRFSTPDAFFAAIAPHAAQLPAVADELQYHAVGCYSAVSALKRAHRQAECRLLAAERLVAQAQVWAGVQPPRERLRALWHDLCFNQFHDILGGTCTREATDEAVAALGRVVLGATELADDMGRAIAARVDTRGPGGTVLLFNPFPEPFNGYVEYEPWTGWQPWQAGGWGLVDEGGRPVAHQRIDPHSAQSHERGGITRLLFRAELPPLGYRLYRFAPGLATETSASPAEQTSATVEREEHSTTTALDQLAQGQTAASPRSVSSVPSVATLENEHLAVRLDLASGAIVSCVDKASGLELVGPGGWNVAQVIEDTSDTWSHLVRGYDNVIGTFRDAYIVAADHGPLQASLLVERSYEGSTWLQQIMLRAGERELLVRNWLVWQGHWQLLKLAFDVALDNPSAAHDVPFGWVARPCDGAEVPTLMWMDVTGAARGAADTAAGLALLNDGKYGCDVSGSVMRLTILRSPPYAYHIPHPVGAKARYDWIDQGYQEFTLALRPHVGDWREARVVQAARALNIPITAVTAHGHPGALPAQAGLLALEAPELELTALKPAEDGDGVIVRLADRHGRGGAGTLRWQGQEFPVVCRPFQVITLRLAQRGGVWTAEACDMIERPER
ncbi:MAG TPA: glycoside hydrolase family 38 C-terminal domain-containing protein [Roseiflexaceae bacterium]|nr:glycoside hydrolase family 38 C-terminal domain-containing protein [Roseiflexaceae bacterium]